MASGYYDITNKTLGKGHYGVVKLGRHCLTGEPVAIKIIEKSRLNPDSLHQLGTEIRILFRLSEYEHPNILKLYQTIDTEDKLYLITEYCGPHACDLHDYISKKHCRDGLKQLEARVFFVQICSAISYCHSMGIVHRDLKPENILVTDYKHMDSKYSGGSRHDTKKSNEPRNNNNNNHTNYHQYPLLKLIDFGFANQCYPDEKMRTSCGTLAYSAPELLLGEPYDGTKVDVWGLGLMLYILLYGRNPFMQINDNETLTRILDCSFATPKRDNIDYDALELLRSLIKRNPDKRLPMDAILQHKWFKVVPKTFECVLLEYQLKNEHASINKPQNITSAPSTESPTPKPPVSISSMPQQIKLNQSQNMSSILPSISEIGPLKNLNKSSDDSANCNEHSEQALSKPGYNRTRSLSITRNHNKSFQQQHQTTSLTHTRSSLQLERLNSNPQSTVSRGSSIYRPTSPDVGGSSHVLTEEESCLHDSVIREMFRLTKLIDSKSSIEASLKNARFKHRQFNQNSIQPSVLGKKKIGSSLIKLFGQGKGEISSLLHGTESKSDKESRPTTPLDKEGSLCVDKIGSINMKLSNDDYIYATYQLTRDRMLRIGKDKLRNQILDEDSDVRKYSGKTSNQSSVIPGENFQANSYVSENQNQDDKVSTKENDRSRSGHQRKLLQPQHKMRDKFTSFFRSGSTSPNSSVNISSDLPSGVDGPLKEHAHHLETHHEAFNDHNNEYSNASATHYYLNKSDNQECSLAYSLPLARKCSLVSEESGCSNDMLDGQAHEKI